MRSVERRLVTATCLVPLVIGGACTEVLAPPRGSESYEPPPEYQLWWNTTEACSGLRGSLSDVSWFVVPGVEVLPGVDRELNGEWFEQGNRIVIAAGSVTTGELIRHEMLHALARENGHPRLQFLERCGGVVTCIDACIRDAGPAPTPSFSTPVVTPDSLEVSIEIDPSSPSGNAFGGYFALLVIARNPSNHAVVVQLPPSGDVDPSFAWEFSVRGRSGGILGNYRAYDSEVFYFRPGEIKRQLVDLHYEPAGANGDFVSGAYIAAGAYGGRAGTPVPFTLTP